MHPRLIRALALAALFSWTACGRSEHAPVDVASQVSPVAADASPPPNGVAPAVAEPERALPASFPRDIQIPEGLSAKSLQSDHAGSYIALFTGDLEPEAVYRYFSEHLVAEGWTIDMAHGAGPEFRLLASKDDRIASVISTRIDGRLHVELGVNGGS